jgi:predicted RNase H-like HicB family nuclease
VTKNIIRYPICIHCEDDTAYGVTIPDFPGCFTSGDTLSEAINNVQEAVVLFLDPGDPIPSPTVDLTTLMSDPLYLEGKWYFIYIDLSFHKS